MHRFEIYLTRNEVTDEDWRRFNLTISQAVGLLKSYVLKVRIDSNVVRYFIEIKNDIGAVSTNLDGFVFRPASEADADLLATPAKATAERLVRFATGGTFLDLREKFQARKAKDLNAIDIRVRNINATTQAVSYNMYFKTALDTYTVNTKRLLAFPAHLLSVDFAANTRYVRKTINKYLKIEKTLHILNSEATDALFTVDTFPYHAKPYYLHLTDYDFDKHSLIIGQSGSGKSKMIELLVDRIAKINRNDTYRVIVIDPHAAIAPNLKHVPNSKFIDFKGDTSDLFPKTNDATAATELSTTLFKSLLADQFNPKCERVLRYSLFLLFTAQSMDFAHLKHLLTNLEWRKQVLDIMQSQVPPNIVQFFHTDFNDLRTKNYNEAILPILTMIDEMEIQPGMNQPATVSLAQTIQNNFLTTFSLNKVSMGEKVVKTIAGLLIQNIFILAQARLFNHKLILIVDEVSVVQNPTMAQILAEARKFGLSLILTQQYLAQVEKDLRDAIFSNNYNYYLFKLSEEDARLIEGNVQIELPEEIVSVEKAERGLKESDVKVKMLSEELHSRECLVRFYADGKFLPCIKARTTDAPDYSHAVSEEEKQLHPEHQPNAAELENFALPSTNVEYKPPVEPTYQYQQYVAQEGPTSPAPKRPAQVDEHQVAQEFSSAQQHIAESKAKSASTSKSTYSEPQLPGPRAHSGSMPTSGVFNATELLHKMHDKNVTKQGD